MGEEEQVEDEGARSSVACRAEAKNRSLNKKSGFAALKAPMCVLASTSRNNCGRLEHIRVLTPCTDIGTVQACCPRRSVRCCRHQRWQTEVGLIAKALVMTG